MFMAAPISKSPHFLKNLLSYGKWRPCIPSGSPHIFQISLCMNHTFQIPSMVVNPFQRDHFLTQLLKKGYPFFMPFIISHALSMVAANFKNPFFFKISMWCESYLHGLKESSLIKSHKKNKNSFHI